MSEENQTTESDHAEGAPLAVSTAQLTDVGRVRTENQDFSILSSPVDEVDADKGRLMVVADGMGGHRGGATASRIAATTIKEEYFGSSAVNLPVALKTALEKANARIYRESQINPDLRGMGTTASALVVRGREAFFAHVGDSRIYLLRQGQIRQLTDDHSLVASMVREGLLTNEEAEVHPRRNVLQRSMGVGEVVEVDLKTGLEVEPGDVFILCSDGLHGLVKEAEMKEVAQLAVEDAAAEFVKRAMERGAPDNVTVIVARVVETTHEELEAEAHAAREERGSMSFALPTEEIPLDPSLDETQPATADLSKLPTAKVAAVTLDDEPVDTGAEGQNLDPEAERESMPTLKISPPPVDDSVQEAGEITPGDMHEMEGVAAPSEAATQPISIRPQEGGGGGEVSAPVGQQPAMAVAAESGGAISAEQRKTPGLLWLVIVLVVIGVAGAAAVLFLN